jgi:hypothetical protein
MYERLQIIALVAVAAIWGLAELARRRPDIGWLRPFRIAFARLPEPQRTAARRRSDFLAGLQFLLLGIALPIGAAVLKLAFFARFSAAEVAIVAAVSALCLALGITGIAKSRR